MITLSCAHCGRAATHIDFKLVCWISAPLPEGKTSFSADWLHAQAAARMAEPGTLDNAIISAEIFCEECGRYTEIGVDYSEDGEQVKLGSMKQEAD